MHTVSQNENWSFTSLMCFSQKKKQQQQQQTKQNKTKQK